ncbi:MAG: nucleotidyltransferase family protein [Acidobacteriota bacterium]
MSEPHVIELLTCCGRATIPENLVDRLRRLCEQVTDWEAVVQSSEEHGLLPLVSSNLQRFCPDILPDRVAHLLQVRATENAAWSLRQLSELATVLRELGAVGITAIPFKGPLLSAALYGSPSARVSTDLDVLIRRRDRLRALSVLKRLDYHLLTPIAASGKPLKPGKFEYHCRRTHASDVELRWRLTAPQFLSSLDLETVLPHCAPSALAGIPTLRIAPEDLLLILCAHGAKHQWERLMWLSDISQLVQSTPHMDWPILRRRGRRLGLGRVLRFSLLLAARLFDAPIPADVALEAIGDKDAVRLAQMVEFKLRGSPDDLADSLYCRAILERRRDRLWNFAQISRLIPNERDRQLISLPAPLQFFYYPIRLVRLLYRQAFPYAGLRE